IRAIEFIDQIKTWNDSTIRLYPKDKNVAEFINEIAIKNPTKTAIYFNDDEVSYTALNQKSNRFAHYLIGLGIKKGDVIGLLLDRSPEMIVALLGIIKSGAVYLPLDPQYPEARIKLMLDDSNAKYIITSARNGISFYSQDKQLLIETIFS